MKDIAELKKIVADLASPLLEAENLEIWGLDIVAGPVLKVCIYIDGKVGEQSSQAALSATIDQCERISRQLGLALDVEDLIDQAWNLEVSSPGLERKFYTLEQLRPYLGDIIDARLTEGLHGSGRKSWRGKLASLTGSSFMLEPCALTAEGEIVPEGSQLVEIPWSAVGKAQRVHVFVAPQKPGKKAAKKQAMK